jgi:hypothetical protein
MVMLNIYKSEERAFNSIFLTFGDGTSDFKFAANRLSNQADKLELFDKIVSLDSDSLALYSREYAVFLKDLPSLAQHPFYFRAVKPFILRAALHGAFGVFDQVLYADAGCEVVNNTVSRARLKRTLNQVRNQSVGCAQEVPYLEMNFTKNYTREYLDPEHKFDRTFQVQSGVIILNNCGASKEFVDKWIEYSHPNLNLWQDPLLPESDLIGHRWDQSIFSIAWKKNHYPIKRFYWDGARTGNRLKDLVTSSYAIQAIRNKTGQSVISRLYSSSTFVASIGLFLLLVFRLIKALRVRLVRLKSRAGPLTKKTPI